MVLVTLALPVAAGVTVTTSADENNGSLDPGLGTGTSLREAVAHAPAGSVIDFAPALSGQTIVLASQISFGKNLTIDASALTPGISVSGNHGSRVFDVPSSRVVAIIRLKIVNGHDNGDGGGIRNAGTLALADCELTGNSAGDGGGAIENSGPLTLTACTLASNTAGVGGGAIEHTANVLTLVNCTLAGNTAEFGGAIDGDGSSTIHLRSCTISANHATNDGGGLEETSGTLLLENTIVAGNTAADQGPDLKASGIDTESGVNLLSGTGGLGGGFSGIVAPPQLAALGDHGGPTRTMPPLAGSPALDAGGPTTLTVDQRGLPRVANGVTDIGAVEVQTANLVTTTADAGPGSLRQVLQDAPAGATIAFDPSLDGGTILLSSPITLVKDVTLDAAARESLAVAGGDATQLLIVNAGVTAVITGVDLRDGVCASGGAIRNSGQLALEDCLISSCQAWDGGALSNATGAVLTLTDCELSGNLASYNGGGLHNQGSATLIRTSVSANGAGEDGGSGGGIYSTGNLSVADSTVAWNEAQAVGGIRSSGTLSMSRASVTANRAWDGSCGGVLVTGGGGSITASTISGNSCIGSGGAVFHGGGPLTITSSTFAGNESDFEFGGAILATAPGVDDLLDIVSSTVAANEAFEEGGGIYVEPGSRLRLENSVVAGNSAFTAGPDLRGSIETQAGVNLVSSTDGIEGGFTGLVAPAQLGPLAGNGGPTWTMLPLPESPVIDAAGPTTLTIDQRGQPRVFGAGADIGAVERQASDSDKEPPTRPLGLTLTGKSASSLSLIWDASTDNTALAGYEVYLDGAQAGSPSLNVFTVSGLEENRSYTLRVHARDSAGNLSPPSNALLATPQGEGLQSPPEAVRTQFHAIVLNYNPNILVDGQLIRADAYYSNRDPDDLVAEYIEMMRKATGGQINWTVTANFELDEWAPPVGNPSPLYTPENAVELRNANYEYDGSYTAIVADPRFDIVGRTNSGQLDAVWIFGAYGTRFSETALVGPGPYFGINGAVVEDPSLDSNLVFYGFGKEPRQVVGFMFENTSHMAEVILDGRLQPSWPRTVSTRNFNTLRFEDPARALIEGNLFGPWTYFTQGEASHWDRALVVPGSGGQCGLSHYPPTALYQYDWSTFYHEFGGMHPFVAIDGTWSTPGGELRAASGNGTKTLARDDELHEPGVAFLPVQAFSDADVEFSVRVTNDSTSSHAGFLFRVFSAATGANQVKGYYIGLNANQDQVVLAKLDNAFIPLASSPLAAVAGTSYRLRLEARGSMLRVYHGKSLTPLISVADTSYITGGFGFSSYGTEAFFDNLDIVTHVASTADDWYTYPDAAADVRDLTPGEWDGDTPRNMNGFYAWWWEHLPKNGGGHYEDNLDGGSPSLLLNNWLPYIFDHNRFATTRPFPDIIFPAEDVSPPSAPGSIETMPLGSSELALDWEAADDDVGVTRYSVFRDGQFLRKTASTHFHDRRLAPGSTYTYEIRACDGSGNTSPPSTLMATTLAADPLVPVADGSFGFSSPEAAGWFTDAFRLNKAVFSRDPAGGREGTPAVSIDATDFNDSSWFQRVDGLLPGATYWLTGWVKGENIQPEPNRTLGANLSLPGNFQHTTAVLTGTFDWQRLSMTFVAPADGILVIACRLGNNGNLTRGKVWFDDIAVVRHSAPRLVDAEKLADGRFRCVLLSPGPATYTLQQSTDLATWIPVGSIPVIHPDTEIIESPHPSGVLFYRATGN